MSFSPIKQIGKQIFKILNWRLALTPILGFALYRWWVVTAESGKYPPFMLPHPDLVWERFQFYHERGLLRQHIEVTLKEALYGLFIAILIGITLGYVLARIRTLNYVLMPYLIFIQAIPVIAISPIILLWAGPELKSKMVIAAFITWFPIMVSTMVGIRNISPNLRELMRANVANPWQVFWHLEVPAALPEIFGGLKIAVTLAVIGAAVGEFVGSQAGLGNLVLRGKGRSDTATVIVAVFLLTIMSLVLYGIVVALESILLRWKRVE